MSEILRDGNLLYTLMHSRWRKGVEEHKNRVTVHFQFDESVPESEREATIAAVRAALADTAAPATGEG